MYYQKKISSPIGALFLVTSKSAIVSIDTTTSPLFEAAQFMNDHRILLQTEVELKQYFQGLRTQFDIPISPTGTSFQLQAWQVLQDIPFGDVLSYKEQALLMKRPKATRAVGAANGKNPILIIIPCHRICGADGKLVGFSGGIEIKIKLLELEGHCIQNGKITQRR